MSKVVYVTDENFEQEILKSNIPAVVDFWAEWCAPCKMIAPAIEELAQDYNGKIKIAKIDIDSSPAIATNMGVMNIPTVMYFKNGKEYKRVVGANPKRSYEDVIKEIL